MFCAPLLLDRQKGGGFFPNFRGKTHREDLTILGELADSNFLTPGFGSIRAEFPTLVRRHGDF
jgi:hypothetical protein